MLVLLGLLVRRRHRRRTNETTRAGRVTNGCGHPKLPDQPRFQGRGKKHRGASYRYTTVAGEDPRRGSSPRCHPWLDGSCSSTSCWSRPSKYPEVPRLQNGTFAFALWFRARKLCSAKSATCGPPPPVPVQLPRSKEADTDFSSRGTAPRNLSRSPPALSGIWFRFSTGVTVDATCSHRCEPRSRVMARREPVEGGFGRLFY